MSDAHNHYFKKVTLGHFLTELPKSTLPASLAITNGSYPFFCSSSIVKYTNTYLQDKSAVLMGTGGVASVNFGSEKFAYSTDTWAFRSNNEAELSTEYIYRVIQKKLPEIGYSAFEGSGLKHLRKEYVKKLKLNIPANKTVNLKILCILGTIDQAIEQTEALIEKYQQIKVGLMHDLFTRGIDADGKLRPYREQAPALYQQTPIGWIPNEWECTRLNKKAKSGIPHLKTGPFGSSLKGEHWAENGHPVITIGALGEGCFTSSELLFISNFDAKRLFDYQMKLGDVVFSRVADVGRSVVIDIEQIGWIMSSNLMRISLDSKLVSSDFLQYQLSFDSRVKKQIRCKVNSGGREVANSEILNGLYFVWPNIDEQNETVRRAEALTLRVNINLHELQ